MQELQSRQWRYSNSHFLQVELAPNLLLVDTTPRAANRRELHR